MYPVFFSREFFVGGLVTLLVCGGASLPSASAQPADLLHSGPSGPTGVTDDTPASETGEDDWAPGLVINSPYTGPLGQMDNRRAPRGL